MNNQFHEALTKTLEARWLNLVDSCHVDQQISAPFFEEIVSSYSEPHRHYHNLNHLNHMFHELESCEADSRNIITNEMLWAVWYHDIVYKSGAKNNEKRSAIKAEESMRKLGIQQSNIDKVVSLILATENHQIKTDDIEAILFLDADMAILGSETEGYSEYCRAVRKEHSNIPNFLFKRGRKKFLVTVLKQGSIFVNSYFKNKYERIARENMQSELFFFNNG